MAEAVRRAAGLLATAAATVAALGCGPGEPDADLPADELPATVRVYTNRLDAPLTTVLEAFEERTGVRTEVVEAPAPELLARLEREAAGGGPTADVLLVDDATSLADPAAADLLAQVDTDALDAGVPSGLADPDGRWWAFAQRARVLAHRCGEDEDDVAGLVGWSAFADSTWHGRVLVGEAGPTTAAALVADVLVSRGDTAAGALAAALPVALARTPRGDDAAQVMALMAGEADVAVVESRAVARVVEGRAGPAPCVRFPGQVGDGAPMTLSAAAVPREAPRRDLAVALLEHLVSDASQTALSWSGHEYPVRPGVPWSPRLLSWGAFRADTTAPHRRGAAERAARALLEAAAEEGEAAAPDAGPADTGGSAASPTFRPAAAPAAWGAPAPRGHRPPPGTSRPPAA